MLDVAELTWVQDAVNRVVFVVPLYCEGNEFQPSAAYQGADETGARGR